MWLRGFSGANASDRGSTTSEEGGMRFLDDRLGVPAVSKTPEEAAEHFGWFARFAAIDNLASSERTRAELGWTPTQPGLLADLDQPYYFRT